MDDREPTKSVSGSDQGTCSYKLGEWGVGDQDHIPAWMIATRLLISDWKATANYIGCPELMLACSHFHKLSPLAAFTIADG